MMADFIEHKYSDPESTIRRSQDEVDIDGNDDNKKRQQVWEDANKIVSGKLNLHVFFFFYILISKGGGT